MKPMIRIVTEMRFENDEELDKYLESDNQAQITGFATEVKEALVLGKPCVLTTPRPKHGALTVSTVQANYSVQRRT